MSKKFFKKFHYFVDKYTIYMYIYMKAVNNSIKLRLRKEMYYG